MKANNRYGKILILDDDPFILKLLSRQLVHLGYGDAVTCERASEALAHFAPDQKNSVDLVITDLQMPEMDGIEFLRNLVNRGYAGNLLLLSGEGSRILQAAARLADEQGMRLLGALEKPVDLETLRQRLEDAEPKPRAEPKPIRKIYSPGQIQQAIAQRQLICLYQPKVSLADGSLAGVESLVRWRHPQDGLILPDQFIAVAEDNGLMDVLTRTVLIEAVDQAARWRKAGLNIKVAVNISMDNLRSLDFPDLVVQVLRHAGVGAENLVLEVTESRLMQEFVSSLDILTRLRLKHVTLSIDDFGTGNSTLVQLRDFPFDELKIDRSFVYGAWRDLKRRAILEGSIQMARKLKMRTVAEGAEDRNDWNLLRQLGCDLVQGYFCAKPMPADQLPEWQDAWEIRRRSLI